jgi:hypothetical protein
MRITLMRAVTSGGKGQVTGFLKSLFVTALLSQLISCVMPGFGQCRHQLFLSMLAVAGLWIVRSQKSREADRSLLMEHFDARLASKKSRFLLPTRRFRQLRIAWKGSTLHFDDKLWPTKKQRPRDHGEIEITVRPSALVILQPAASVSI